MKARRFALIDEPAEVSPPPSPEWGDVSKSKVGRAVPVPGPERIIAAAAMLGLGVIVMRPKTYEATE